MKSLVVACGRQDPKCDCVKQRGAAGRRGCNSPWLVQLLYTVEPRRDPTTPHHTAFLMTPLPGVSPGNCRNGCGSSADTTPSPPPLPPSPPSPLPVMAFFTARMNKIAKGYLIGGNGGQELYVCVQNMVATMLKQVMVVEMQRVRRKKSKLKTPIPPINVP